MTSLQLNLLPDIRLAKLRDKRRRALVGAVMTAILVICGGIVILGVGITGAQALQIQSLSANIKNSQNQVTNTPDIIAILTIQQNLNSLSTLNKQRINLNKFFILLQSLDPKDILVSSLSLNEQNLLTIVGQARSYGAASHLAQSMAASNVTLGPSASLTNTPDFTGVSLSSLAADNLGRVGFTIIATISPGVTSGN